MARKEKKIQLTDDGRELTFVIKQMPATAGFLFGAKVARFVCRNNAEVEPGDSMGALFIKAIGGFDMDEFKSVMDEALGAVTYTGGTVDQVCSGNTLDAILVDPANVFKLVKESVEMNVAFITRAIPADFQEKIRGAVAEVGTTLQTSTKGAK